MPHPGCGFGVGPAFLMSCRKFGRRPSDDVELTSVRESFATVLTALDGLRWIYGAAQAQFLPANDKRCAKDVCSGSSFLPVRAREIADSALRVPARALENRGNEVEAAR